MYDAGRCYVLERQNYSIQVFGSIVTGVADRPREEIQLSPDPSRGPVTVRFDLPGLDGAMLTIVDVGGRRLGQWRLPGSSGVFSWDGPDRSGRLVSSGTYFARLSKSLGRFACCAECPHGRRSAIATRSACTDVAVARRH